MNKIENIQGSQNLQQNQNSKEIILQNGFLYHRQADLFKKKIAQNLKTQKNDSVSILQNQSSLKIEKINQKAIVNQINENQQDQNEDEFLISSSLLPKRYLWIDPNIQSSQNQNYYFNLRIQCKIDIRAMSTSQRAILEIKNDQQFLRQQNNGQKIQELKYQIICAASLQDQDFKKFQSNPKIVRILIFCQSKQRANVLKKNFKKITKQSIFFKIDPLKKQILRAQNEM